MGGGTFCGLCSLLTGTESFDEAISLAENVIIQKWTSWLEIYTDLDYNKMGLTGNVVASR